MSRWIRNRPDRKESVVAALVAGSLGAVVGMATFYVVRLLVAREPLEAPPGEDQARDGKNEGPER